MTRARIDPQTTTPCAWRALRYRMPGNAPGGLDGTPRTAGSTTCRCHARPARPTARCCRARHARLTACRIVARPPSRCVVAYHTYLRRCTLAHRAPTQQHTPCTHAASTTNKRRFCQFPEKITFVGNFEPSDTLQQDVREANESFGQKALHRFTSSIR